MFLNEKLFLNILSYLSKEVCCLGTEVLKNQGAKPMSITEELFLKFHLRCLDVVTKLQIAC